MFGLRCVGVSLAFFLTQYCLLSVLVGRAWPWLARLARTRRPLSLANYLLALRLLPLAVAFASTIIFVIPSFLLLEPHTSKEEVGLDPTVLSLCCLALVAFGLRRALRAQAQSTRVVAEWLREATPFAHESFGEYPVFEIRPALPALTVAGVREPRVLVSRAAASLLEAREMRTALQHEVAHIRHRDNLKKLFFNFTAFPGMSGLESAWSDAGEFAADDAAVKTASDALDLASALIKLSRLGPITDAPELATALVEGQNAILNSRVERLLAWQQDAAVQAPERLPWFVIGAGIAFTIGLIASYSAVLERMHDVTEWLVR